jgi:two-component system, cell cycle sensor histidine kinase and response regulator CckA
MESTMDNNNSNIKDPSHAGLEAIIAERTADLLKINSELQQQIAERKKAESALRKSEKGFRLLMEYTPDLLFINDARGKIIDANQLACETLGYTREELLNLSIGDIEEQIIEHQEKLKRSIRGIPVTFEGMQKRKDGTLFPVEVRLWIFESGDEELMLALVRDISDRKRQEESRKKMEAQIIFSEKMQSIGTLAGGIAHNFNNLLMGIQGNASLMMFDKKHGSPDYTRLNNIQKLIDKGAILTGQLMGYARGGVYDIKAGDLNMLVKETLDVFLKDRKNITAHLDLAIDLAGTRIDEVQIKQVLNDLFSNAAEAMPDGGGLFIKTENVTHENISGTEYEPKPGRYAAISIKDTGTGMNKETLTRAFEPFFTTKSLARKTGLGLASAYGIIKGHGGYIEAESEPDHGSVFNLFLPALNISQDRIEKADEQYFTGKGTVLLVDDDEMVLDTGEQILVRLGYSVMTAADGKEALKVYEDHRDQIDVVLLDMVMPEISGGEVYDRIKEINPDVKAILLSGYGRDGEANEILDRGCDAFIQKPFNLTELSKKLKEIIDRE